MNTIERIKIVCLAACAGWVWAASGTTTTIEPPAPGFPEVQTDADGLARAQRAIERARERYATLHSYAAKIEDGTERAFEDGTTDTSVHDSQQVIYDRTGKMRIDRAGTQQYFGEGRLTTFAEQYAQYTQVEAPDFSRGLEEVPMRLRWLWKPDVAAIMLGKAAPPLFVDQADYILGSVIEARDGQPGLLVVVKTKADEFNGMPAGTTGLWFNDQTGLLGEIRYDATQWAKRHREEEIANDPAAADWYDPVQRESHFIRFKQVSVDEPIAPDRFTFRPDGSVKLVEEFERPDVPKPTALIGTTAPAFEVASVRIGDADGKVSLGSLSGRVVVLDFWATWCGPCVHSMPMLKDLAGEFANEAVTFLGINRDEQLTPQRLQAWLTKRKLDGVHAMDPKGDIAKLYRVSGIPHLVIIDKAGVIQHVQVGIDRSEKDKLAGHIRSVLEGKAVHTPEKIAAYQTGSAEAKAASRQPRMGPKFDLPEVSPERFVSSYPARRHMGTSVRDKQWVDLDQDGQLELVGVDLNARGLFMLAPGQTEQRVLKLEGLSRGQHPEEWMILDAPDGRRILASVRTSDDRISQSMLLCCDTSGKKLWSYEVPDRDGLQVRMDLHTGDVVGDAGPEILVIVSATKMTGKDRQQFAGTTSSLLVLDAEGRTLAQRTLGGQFASITLEPKVSQEKQAILVFAEGVRERFTIRE